MKAKDLMIGNLYDATDGSCVSIVRGKDLYAWEQGAVYGKPIPLTSEWIVKFGLNLNIDFFSPEDMYAKESFSNPRRAVGVYETECSGVFFVMFREDIGIRWVDLNEISTVHELQQMFFVLTGGDELTLI